MTSRQPKIYPVILAGGASSRLWPLSGPEKPKWALRLAKSARGKTQSLLQGAWARARAVAPAADCFVVSGGAQAALVRSSLKGLPPRNLLVEPQPRDTSGAVAYATGAVLRRQFKVQNSKFKINNGGEPLMLVLPGDHVIAPVAEFTRCVHAAAEAALKLDALVTFGIIPRAPSTAYGYIRRGTEQSAIRNPQSAITPQVYHVQEFREKPDQATAERYLASGEYFWNGGIFLWKVSTLVKEMQRQLPGHAAMASALSRTALNDSAAWQKAAERHFPKLNKISIDFGIMEKAEKVATVAAGFQWDDIGSWSAVAGHLERDGENAVGPKTGLIQIDARGNVVYAPHKRVALVGVAGLAVVESGNDILVCRLDRDQQVKKVSEEGGCPSRKKNI